MKKIIGISSIAILSMAMFFNANAANSLNIDFNLATLIATNVANAEDNCPCYDTYELGGSWTITKCNGCTQVVHVDGRIDESTCPCN